MSLSLMPQPIQLQDNHYITGGKSLHAPGCAVIFCRNVLRFRMKTEKGLSPGIASGRTAVARTGLRDTEAKEAGFDQLTVETRAWDHKQSRHHTESCVMERLFKEGRLR